jgi:hypothetical protein
MVDVGMNLMPSKIIGREACIWARGHSKLTRDFGPKKHPNT